MADAPFDGGDGVGEFCGVLRLEYEMRFLPLPVLMAAVSCETPRHEITQQDFNMAEVLKKRFGDAVFHTYSSSMPPPVLPAETLNVCMRSAENQLSKSAGDVP